jgi:hypothetical protein
MTKFNKFLLGFNIALLAIISIFIVIIIAHAWTNPPGNPPSGGGVISYSGGNTTISSNLVVTGSAVNTCRLVAYTHGATVSCPQYYYVTTGISNPPYEGEMLCCKVENPK